jgi:Amt family ammonium transporter
MQLDKKRTKGGSVMRGLGAALLLMLPVMVFGADTPPPPNKGDVSWLMTATVLVILMTIPGLALFYGGMVRGKNVLSLLMQVMIIFCIGVLMFAIYGYSMSFSEGHSSLAQFVGSFDKIFLKGMTGDSLTGTFSKATNIPELGFFCFQATFAAITPALIVGAFAERIKFSALLVFIVIWLTFAYYPIAHMVWFWAGPDAYTTQAAADAVTPHNGFLFNKGALDFAGGTVVHINAGIAGIIGCMLIKKRIGFGQTALPPHNVPYVMVGAALLWVGWFGFNVGSNLEANGFATLVFTNTLLATAAATMAWMFGEWVFKGSPTMLGAASGAVAGLVAITPACGWVGTMGSIAIGAAAALICLWAVTWLKHKLGYDDSLDVFGVHCIGGITGALLTGVFNSPALGGTDVYDYVANAYPDPSKYSIADHVISQAWGVGVTILWCGIVSLIAYKIVDLTIGLRVTEEQEREGLDTVSHGERAYNN